MRKNRISMLLFFTVIFGVIIYSAYGMLDQGKEDEYDTVSVIVNDSSNERWDAFREGLEQGAEDNHIHLNFVYTGKFQDAEEQYAAIKKELDAETDGIIIAPYSSEEDGLLPTLTSVPTVLVQSGIETDKLFTTVMTDHGKAGKSLADAVIEDGVTSVGIFSGNQRQQGMRQKLKVLKEELEAAGVVIEWVVSDKELIRKLRSSDADKLSVDVVVSLENDSTEKAVDMLLESSKFSYKIYGEGRSEKLMYYLDKGIIQELIVPNEYYMGYQGMSIVAQNIQYHTEKTEQVEVDFFRVTKDNLYEEEMSRILFPIVR